MAEIAVAPFWGRGLKHPKSCCIEMSISVAPFWGRGLKPLKYPAMYAIRSVAPFWGRGLKPGSSHPAHQESLRRSLLGAWIETRKIFRYKDDVNVAPFWGRGLKRFYSTERLSGSGVAPFWGRGLKPVIF